MLVRYKVSNFLSFYEEQEFSMRVGKSKGHQEHIYTNKKNSLLKGAYLYGANAAGKSNFIKSIAFARSCILKGIPGVNTIEKQYKLNKESLKEVSEFEFEILIGEKIYAYGFSLMLETKQVIEEWLYEVLMTKDKLIFSRKLENGKSKVEEQLKLSASDRVKAEVYIDDLENTNLLLEILGKKKFEKQSYEFTKVLNWFRENLIIVFPDTSHFINEYFDITTNWEKYLEYFDTGIEGIDFKDRAFKELPIPEDLKEEMSNHIAELTTAFSNKSDGKIPKIVINTNNNFLKIFLENNELRAKEIVFKHKSVADNIEFKFYEESDGTKRLIELIPLLEKVSCKNHTILIDELERSLHPVLVKAFLDRFYLKLSKSNSQLILSTHESRLLDLDRVRRDEIWFLEKDVEKGTKLFSLEEFKTRFDTKVDKAYLLGRYGGIPNIRDIIIESVECDN
ncbi:AAA family ATPase [Cetobacterium sp.]|uniref:AAA family ATPase n=1 Tax=Cetobacterium sp. TaxID=2071632 RepID=UPI003F380BAA